MALIGKLKGGTLIETMVAMVIITMSLGIGSLTISGVLEISDSHREAEARLGSSGYETSPLKGFKVTTSEKEYEDVPELVIKTTMVFDEGGKELYQEKKLIPKNK